MRTIGVLSRTAIPLVCLGGLAAYLYYDYRERHELRARLEQAVVVADRAERAARQADNSSRLAAHGAALERNGVMPEQPSVPDAAPSQPTPRAVAPRARGSPGEEQVRAEQQIARFEAAMHGETRDRAWASQAESAIQRGFSDRSADQSRIDQLDCRQTMCSLVVIHESTAAYDSWISHAIHDPLIFSKMLTLRRVKNNGRVETRSLLVKVGNDLPKI